MQIPLGRSKLSGHSASLCFKPWISRCLVLLSAATVPHSISPPLFRSGAFLDNNQLPIPRAWLTFIGMAGIISCTRDAADTAAVNQMQRPFRFLLPLPATLYKCRIDSNEMLWARVNFAGKVYVTVNAF